MNKNSKIDKGTKKQTFLKMKTKQSIIFFLVIQLFNDAFQAVN